MRAPRLEGLSVEEERLLVCAAEGGAFDEAVSTGAYFYSNQALYEQACEAILGRPVPSWIFGPEYPDADQGFLPLDLFEALRARVNELRS